jgi:hypothetical protein
MIQSKYTIETLLTPEDYQNEIESVEVIKIYDNTEVVRVKTYYIKIKDNWSFIDEA